MGPTRRLITLTQVTPDPLFSLPDHTKAADFEGRRANLALVGQLPELDTRAATRNVSVDCPATAWHLASMIKIAPNAPFVVSLGDG